MPVYIFQMDLKFCVLLLQLTLCYAQNIQIQDLSTNPGVVTLRTKSTLIKNGHYHVYHEVDLSQYKPVLAQLHTILTGLRSFSNIKDIVEMLVVTYDEIMNIYSNLFPKIRSKKGAFNFLGSTVKLITGNLDQEDYNRIQSEIEILTSKSNKLIQENNLQATINEKLQTRLNKIVQSINDQQTKIRKQIIENRQAMLDSNNNSQNFISLIKI